MGMFGDSREFTLPSGRILVIECAPWRDSEEIVKTVAAEGKTLPMNSDSDHFSLFKDVICSCIDSPRMEKALKKCFEHCTIDKTVINDDTFAKVEHRGDLYSARLEVALDNALPFVKPLLPKLNVLVERALMYLVSRLGKTLSSLKLDSQSSDTAEAPRQQ
jgi:hypothetical protein